MAKADGRILFIRALWYVKVQNGSGRFLSIPNHEFDLMFFFYIYLCKRKKRIGGERGIGQARRSVRKRSEAQTRETRELHFYSHPILIGEHRLAIADGDYSGSVVCESPVHFKL